MDKQKDRAGTDANAATPRVQRGCGGLREFRRGKTQKNGERVENLNSIPKPSFLDPPRRYSAAYPPLTPVAVSSKTSSGAQFARLKEISCASKFDELILVPSFVTSLR